ncbi:MAG: AtpZ/AtpI family protein [Bryobacteraceae bacterium]
MNDTGKIGKYMELALLLPISSMIGYAMGYGLDKLFHTHFLYIVFLFLGIAAGIIQLIRELQKDSADGS